MTTRPESNILSDLKVVEVASNKFFKNAREHLGRHKLLIEFLGSRRPDLGAEVAATLQKAINDASLPGATSRATQGKPSTTETC